MRCAFQMINLCKQLKKANSGDKESLDLVFLAYKLYLQLYRYRVLCPNFIAFQSHVILLFVTIYMRLCIAHYWLVSLVNSFINVIHAIETKENLNSTATPRVTVESMQHRDAG